MNYYDIEYFNHLCQIGCRRIYKLERQPINNWSLYEVVICNKIYYVEVGKKIGDSKTLIYICNNTKNWLHISKYRNQTFDSELIYKCLDLIDYGVNISLDKNIIRFYGNYNDDKNTLFYNRSCVNHFNTDNIGFTYDNNWLECLDSEYILGDINTIKYIRYYYDKELKRRYLVVKYLNHIKIRTDLRDKYMGINYDYANIKKYEFVIHNVKKLSIFTQKLREPSFKNTNDLNCIDVIKYINNCLYRFNYNDENILFDLYRDYWLYVKSRKYRKMYKSCIKELEDNIELNNIKNNHKQYFINNIKPLIISDKRKIKKINRIDLLINCLKLIYVIERKEHVKKYFKNNVKQELIMVFNKKEIKQNFINTIKPELLNYIEKKQLRLEINPVQIINTLSSLNNRTKKIFSNIYTLSEMEFYNKYFDNLNKYEKALVLSLYKMDVETRILLLLENDIYD
ncbi:hypothetical protein Hokovirus_3_141 [Hokovirus HKV1]|uniref:Uncharacterized protein n=1 Tax=Hokovirus HKV1 TaxID=1977638 RepID=A0A1V0SGV3_9VIRU|nr:hypothetical protein Hokovirus_3_141 [Hokovirus HKV1]